MEIKKINFFVDKYRILPQAAKASLWFLACAFLQKAVQIVITPILTRLFTTAEYGQYSVFNSWMGIVTIFITLNLYSGVYAQGIVKFEDDRSAFSSSMQGLMTTMVVVYAGIYSVSSELWNQLLSITTVQMFAMFLMIWATGVYNFWAAEQRVEYRYKKLVFITIIVSIFKPLFGITAIILGNDNVTAYVATLAIVEVVAFSGLFWEQIQRGKKIFVAKYWKYALIFNVPLIPHYLSQTILNSSDRIMIAKMCGERDAGIYSLAYSVSLFMLIFNTALMQTISPWIYRKIKCKKIDSIAPIAYSSLGIIAIVNLIIIAFAPEVIKIFAPEEYYEAIWIIPPIAMSAFFMYAYDLFAKFAFYYEKTIFITIASVAGALLNLGLNYFFIEKMGYAVAAYTTLICYMLYALLHYLFMNRVCKKCCKGEKPYEGGKIIAITFGFLLCGFMLQMTYRSNVVRLGIIALSIVWLFVYRKKIILLVNEMLSLKER